MRIAGAVSCSQDRERVVSALPREESRRSTIYREMSAYLGKPGREGDHLFAGPAVTAPAADGLAGGRARRGRRSSALTRSRVIADHRRAGDSRVTPLPVDFSRPRRVAAPRQRRSRRRRLPAAQWWRRRRALPLASRPRAAVFSGRNLLGGRASKQPPYLTGSADVQVRGRTGGSRLPARARVCRLSLRSAVNCRASRTVTFWVAEVLIQWVRIDEQRAQVSMLTVPI